MAAFACKRPDTAFALDKSGKETASFKDERHLAFIRKLPSAVSGAYPCEACHIRAGSPRHNKKATGKAQKPSDCWTVPLTAEEHRDQHNGNEMSFWRRNGVDPFDLAEQLYQVTGDIEAGIAIIRRNRPSPLSGADLWPAGYNEEGE